MNSFNSRRVGLSRQQRPEPLLSQVHGRRTQPDPSGRSPSKMPKPKVKEPVALDAPPLSTDDEDEDVENDPAQVSPKPGDSSDDDEINENWERKRDMAKTKFGKSNNSAFPKTTKGSKPNNQFKSSRDGKPPKSPQSEISVGSAGSKRAADSPQAGIADHLTNVYGFTKDSNDRPKKRPRGSLPRQTGSQAKPLIRAPGSRTKQYGAFPSQKPTQSRTSPASNDSKSPEKAKFKSYDITSPENRTPAKKRFKAPADLDSSPGLSPSKRKPKFQHLDYSSDKSPEKPKFSLPGDDIDTASESESGSKRKPRSSTQVAKRATFTLPDDLADVALSHDIDSVQIVAESSLHGLSDNEDDSPGRFSVAECPMCHVPVDRQLLEKHLDHGRMSVKKQMAFCRLHKQKTAASSGTERGYPKIDWATIEERFEKHMPRVKGILEGKRSSHYADILRSKVEAGEDRTLLKMDENITPGYYGPRGLRAMTEFLIRTLSSVIRKRAVEESLIAARGYTRYVQAVLVPELAVALIMEDMSASDHEARDILKDSVDVGELLQEETGDVVTNETDDEDGI